jgi:hypothetical protein
MVGEEAVGTKGAKLALATVVLLASGCSVRGPYFTATVIEPPSSGEGGAADGWVAVVELESREVLGA